MGVQYSIVGLNLTHAQPGQLGHVTKTNGVPSHGGGADYVRPYLVLHVAQCFSCLKLGTCLIVPLTVRTAYNIELDSWGSTQFVREI